jgi:signal transduction histidine kinase/HAMP domain-containing protein
VQLKNSIIWRMLAWFLLLALVPLGTVIIFVQRQVNQTILDVELDAASKEARLLAAETINHPDALEELARLYGGAGELAFILDSDGTYISHSDRKKPGALANGDFPDEILQSFFSDGGGGLENAAGSQIIGYAAIPGQNAVAVIVKDNQPVTDTLHSLSRSIALQLSVILLITSIISGVAILAFINPLRQLASFADQVGSGNLDATIDQTDLEGEIAVLADSLNNMSIRLRDLISNLESKVGERTRDLAIASEVSRQITRVLDLDMLLPELVQKTQQGFNLYHVSLYLFEIEGHILKLAASATREGDPEKLKADVVSIDEHSSVIANAARGHQVELVQDTREASGISFDALLPETLSEAAFPMLVGDELVGVLDLQSKSAGRFQENETQIFSTLAEQIAIAVQNAQLYREQEHVAQELERADLMKSQFLASMSHELRTPLNAIINFTQLITMGAVGPLTDEQQSMLTTSLESSKHLLQLINDVLDISKIQAGKLSLYLEEGVDLNEEIRAVIDIAEPLLRKQNEGRKTPVRFIIDIDHDLPAVACDRRRLRQILLNLLSNAIKFTSAGSITLSVKREANRSVFAVMDTGPGIPTNMHSRVFEPFIQAREGIMLAQGTGLGLPISRSLAKAHNGELWIESEVGVGTTFFFSLPNQPGAA